MDLYNCRRSKDFPPPLRVKRINLPFTLCFYLYNCRRSKDFPPPLRVKRINLPFTIFFYMYNCRRSKDFPPPLRVKRINLPRVGIKPGFYHKAQPGGFYGFYECVFFLVLWVLCGVFLFAFLSASFDGITLW